MHLSIPKTRPLQVDSVVGQRALAVYSVYITLRLVLLCPYSPYMSNGYVQETFGMPSEVTQTGSLDGMAGRQQTPRVHRQLIPLHQLSKRS